MMSSITISTVRSMGIAALSGTEAKLPFGASLLETWEQQAPHCGRFIPSPTPALDSECLLAHILEKDRTFILSHRDYPVSETEFRRFTAAITQRQSGLPVAYITGNKEFFGLRFTVTPDVLIPKPDTELLVERGYAIILEKVAAAPEKKLSVCDMCTGSGCVAIALLKTISQNRFAALLHLPDFTLADISAPALKIAKVNADTLLSEGEKQNVHFIQSDLFRAIERTFDVITANPPYIPSAMARALLTDGRNEPLLALDGDAEHSSDAAGKQDGLSVIRRFLPEAHAHLVAGGTLLMEAGEYNIRAAGAEAQKAGFSRVQIFQDLEGQPRLLQAEK